MQWLYVEDLVKLFRTRRRNSPEVSKALRHKMARSCNYWYEVGGHHLAGHSRINWKKKVTKNSIRSIKSVNIYENENKDLEKACIFRTQLSLFFFLTSPKAVSTPNKTLTSGFRTFPCAKSPALTPTKAPENFKTYSDTPCIFSSFQTLHFLAKPMRFSDRETILLLDSLNLSALITETLLVYCKVDTKLWNDVYIHFMP